MGLFIAVGLLVVISTGLVLFVKTGAEEFTQKRRLTKGKIVALAATAGGLVVAPYLVGDTKDVERVHDLRMELRQHSEQAIPLGSDPWKTPEFAPAGAEQEAAADALQAQLEAEGYQVIRSDSVDLRTLEPNPRGFFLPAGKLKDSDSPQGTDPPQRGAGQPEEDLNWAPWVKPPPKTTKRGLAQLVPGP